MVDHIIYDYTLLELFDKSIISGDEKVSIKKYFLEEDSFDKISSFESSSALYLPPYIANILTRNNIFWYNVPISCMLEYASAPTEYNLYFHSCTLKEATTLVSEIMTELTILGIRQIDNQPNLSRIRLGNCIIIFHHTIYKDYQYPLQIYENGWNNEVGYFCSINKALIYSLHLTLDKSNDMDDTINNLILLLNDDDRIKTTINKLHKKYLSIFKVHEILGRDVFKIISTKWLKVIVVDARGRLTG